MEVLLAITQATAYADRSQYEHYVEGDRKVYQAVQCSTNRKRRKRWGRTQLTGLDHVCQWNQSKG